MDSLDELRFLFPDSTDIIRVPERHQEAVHRLALDLSLSRLVLHTNDCGLNTEQSKTQLIALDPEDDDDDVARAAGQLTLRESEAPRIIFSYLHPPSFESNFIHSSLPEVVSQDAIQLAEDELQSPTARALLSEWTIGEDPKAYAWTPCRDTTRQGSVSTTTGRPVRPLPSPRPAQGPQTFTGAATQPPHFHAATSVPSLMPSIPAFGSIPSIPMTQIPRSSAGEPTGYMQTQVERGPFGARPGATKKKVKKRVGGF